MRVTVLVGRLAVHVLHHIVRHAVRRIAAIEDAGDVGMIERGEHLPLLLEAQDELRRDVFPQQQFHGHVLAEGSIVADGQIDDAHPAAAEFAQEFVDADVVPGGGALRFGGGWREARRGNGRVQ